MRNYESCAKLYGANRKYAPLGVKFGRELWLSYDDKKDCYIASLIVSKYFETMDNKGETCWRKASAKERDKYTMKVLARYFQDRIELVTPNDQSRNATANFLADYMRLLVRRIPSIKQQGFQWTRYHQSTPYYKRNHGEGEVVLSKGDITINAEGEIIANAPPLERVFDKDNQKALNGRIREVRRMLGLRSKLGTFNGLDLEALETKCLADWGPRHTVEAKTITTLLMQVVDDDHTSVLPLLWLSLGQRVRYYQSISKMESAQNWLELFNAFIDSNKESLRKHNNVVSYVDSVQKEEAGSSLIG